uniref:Uncharacterized protein n=1 Tax=Anguilla anguilla TaxID=7936 RepID=A0A0E9WYQ5_ANGAN
MCDGDGNIAHGEEVGAVSHHAVIRTLICERCPEDALPPSSVSSSTHKRSFTVIQKRWGPNRNMDTARAAQFNFISTHFLL